MNLLISYKSAKLLEILPDKLVDIISHNVVKKCLKKANIKVTGTENIDTQNPVIYVCNHLSNSDGLVLDKVFKDAGINVSFVAGIKLSKNAYTIIGIHVVNTIFIHPNTADKDAIMESVKTLKKGKSILIFPEGTRSRKKSMIRAKRGIILIHKLSKAPIIPVGIHGSEDFMPINDESMGNEKFYNADVYVNIGKRIQMPDRNHLESRHEYDERMTEFIMKKVAALLPERYRGVYK